MTVSRGFIERAVTWPLPESAQLYGIDIWLTGSAAREGHRITQVPLGRKIHNPGFPKIVKKSQQVIDALWHLAYLSGAPRPACLAPDYSVWPDDGRYAVGTVLVVPGADTTVPRQQGGGRPWPQVASKPVPLTSLYCCHDLLITRAGRDTLAEAACCGIPTVALPVTADPHRAGEQHANAAVAHLPGMFTPRDWRDRDTLLGSALRALGAAARGTRTTGQRGNAAAAALARELVPAVSPADRGAVL